MESKSVLLFKNYSFIRPNFEFLFEKEAAERKAKIDEEKRKFKELVKREKQRIKDEEVKAQEMVQIQRESESEKRQREKEAKYAGRCLALAADFLK